MTASRIIRALDLPDAALVERRVPKTLLIEHGAPTPADKRTINDGVEHVQWIAALKPTTVGVAEHRDDEREYLEIAVLSLTLRAGAKLSRLIELLHRAVPYPVVAVAEQNERVHLSLVHKRRSQGEVARTVLDGDLVSVGWAKADESNHAAFLTALALGLQPRGTLFTLYQGWIDTLLALQAAQRTNAFEIAQSADRLEARRDALIECGRLEAEIARLRAAGAKEKQMSRRVELNLELKRVEDARAAALARL